MELIKAHKCKVQTEIGVWNFCIQLITNEDIPNDKVTFKKNVLPKSNWH